ncbi:unnamed protein product, partial [marine sediment metagenome]
HDQALATFEKAESLALELNDVEELTSATTNIAVEKRYMGEYNKALEAILEALGIREELGLNYTVLLNNLANIYYDIGEYQLASEYFDKALARSEKLQWLIERGMILGDYAKLYLSEGHVSKAKKLLQESLAYYEESGAEVGLVEKLCLDVELHIAEGDLEEAKVILAKAKELAVKHRSMLEQQQCQLTSALLEKSAENYGNARSILIELLEDAEDYEFFEIHINTCLALAELYLERYQWKQLSNHFKAAQKYLDEAERLSKQAKLVPK